MESGPSNTELEMKQTTTTFYTQQIIQIEIIFSYLYIYIFFNNKYVQGSQVTYPQTKR